MRLSQGLEYDEQSSTLIISLIRFTLTAQFVNEPTQLGFTVTVRDKQNHILDQGIFTVNKAIMWLLKQMLGV